MFTENFEFHFSDAPIVFKENLSAKSSLIHKEAITRAQRYLIAEAELLEIIIEIDKARIYEEFGLTHLTPYCVKHLGLSEDVAANFVRVARKSQQVPELKTAIDEGRLSVTKAKTIASVITSENHAVWIEKAETQSKDRLEKEIAAISPQARKSEKAKVTSATTVRVEFDLTLEEMKLFRRAQDLVSQKLGRSASLAETQNALLELFLDAKDPVRKAARALKRTAAKETKSLTRIHSILEKNEKETKSINVATKVLEQKTTKSQNPFKQNQSVTSTKISESHPPIDNISPNQKAPVPGPVTQPQKKKSSRKPLKAKLIHAVNQRDNRCCQAILPDGSMCGHSRWVQVHHMTPVSHGGQDTIENLITLCSSHHRIWHQHN